MQMIERTLEGWNLSYVLALLALLGFFLAVYVNQLTRYEAEDAFDPPALRTLSWCGYILCAWSLLWIISFAEARHWQPWPPVVLLIVAIDIIMLKRALAIKARIRRTGVRPESPSALASQPVALRKVVG